jgi:hypothetical protein
MEYLARIRGKKKSMIGSTKCGWEISRKRQHVDMRLSLNVEKM